MVFPVEGTPTKTDAQLVQVDLSTRGTLFLPSKCHWPAPGFLSVLLQPTSDHSALLDSQTQGPSSAQPAHARCWETRMCTLKTFILSEIVPSDSVSSRSLLSLNPRGICFRPIFSTLTSDDRPSRPGQRGLACCCPWGHKELDSTQRLNNNHIGKLLGGSFL